MLVKYVEMGVIIFHDYLTRECTPCLDIQRGVPQL